MQEAAPLADDRLRQPGARARAASGAEQANMIRNIDESDNARCSAGFSRLQAPSGTCGGTLPTRFAAPMGSSNAGGSVATIYVRRLAVQNLVTGGSDRRPPPPSKPPACLLRSQHSCRG